MIETLVITIFSLFSTMSMQLSNQAMSSTSWWYQSYEYMVVFYNHNFFYQYQNALSFNWDMCCHLMLCFWLIIFHLTW
jgi:hypothetical protein